MKKVKLSLNKTTVAQLQDDEKSSIRGGRVVKSLNGCNVVASEVNDRTVVICIESEFCMLPSQAKCTDTDCLACNGGGESNVDCSAFTCENTSDYTKYCDQY